MNQHTRQSDQLTSPDIFFLISQPRAGSTLLQKIIAQHTDVSTTSEPWVMLPAVSVLRKGSFVADYDAEWASVALDSFLETLPRGRETYFEGLRRMYGYLYSQALSATQGRIFLDKTPRYYLIIPQLLEIFPHAKIILLLRNPLAVLVSVIRTWTGVAPGALNVCRDDLLLAPRLLSEAVRYGGNQITVVRYEDLLASPEATIQNLCQSLHIEYQEKMLKYDAPQDQRWILGDQKKVYEAALVDCGNHEKWVESLSDVAFWRLCRDYLEQLGENLYSALGYEWEQAQAALAETRPGRFQRTWSLSLERCLNGRPPANMEGGLFNIAGKYILKFLALTRSSQ